MYKNNDNVKTKSRSERLLSEIYVARLCKNQQMCIDCLKPRSKKKKSPSVKIVAALTFMSLIIKILRLKYSPFGDV